MDNEKFTGIQHNEKRKSGMKQLKVYIEFRAKVWLDIQAAKLGPLRLMTNLKYCTRKSSCGKFRGIFIWALDVVRQF